MTTDKTQPNRTRSRDGRFGLNDRVAAKKAFSWQPSRGGKIFKFSPEGGLAFVEWDDKLGPQCVAIGDLINEGSDDE